MKKKLTVAAILVGLCISLVGCGGVSKDCNEINKIQKSLANLDSGHMTILSKVESANRNENMSTDFTYRVNDNGVMEYCQTQMDKTNKLIFCEMSDGEKAEQWLLGKGWGAIDATTYTKENPHQYLGLLTNKLDKKIIKDIKKEEQDSNTVYNVELDENKLNQTSYKDADMEIVSQNISFSINEKGELICYNDNAVIMDKATQSESNYNLEVQLSEHNAVTEIQKPDLKVSAAVTPKADDGK